MTSSDVESCRLEKSQVAPGRAKQVFYDTTPPQAIVSMSSQGVNGPNFSDTTFAHKSLRKHIIVLIFTVIILILAALGLGLGLGLRRQEKGDPPSSLIPSRYACILIPGRG